MFNYIFMGSKYTLEAFLLCLAMSLLFCREFLVAAKVTLRVWWLYLISGAIQFGLFYLLTVFCGNRVQAKTFTVRYLIVNAATIFVFWKIALKKKGLLCTFYGSHILVSMQFCQIFGTYIVYTARSSLQVVTDFMPFDQLVSGSVICISFAAIIFVLWQLAKRNENIMAWEALLCAIFDWLFLIIGRLMGHFFTSAQLFPYVTAILYFLFIIELTLFFAVAIEMLCLRKNAVEEAWLSQQYALQKQYAVEMSSLYQDFRLLRHEEKNHQIYVLHLLENEKYEELNSYFSRLSQVQNKLEGGIDCGNTLVNAILWSKMQIAERENIPLQIEAHLPETIPIRGEHLCSVLVNLLNNAIEASRQVSAPDIRVNLSMRMNYFFCCVSNRADKNVIATNPEMRSTKGNSKYHGYGIKSIRHIAEYYDGQTEFTFENGFFVATVMLACDIPIPDEAKE